MSGQRIIEGLKQAVAGDFKRVTIEGQVWTREAGNFDHLRDALRGLLDWVEEGCPDGGAYAITEAKAALANIRTLPAANQTTKPDTQ